MVMSLESKRGWHSSTVYMTLCSGQAGLAGLQEVDSRLALCARLPAHSAAPVPSAQPGPRTQGRGRGLCIPTGSLPLEAPGARTVVPGGAKDRPGQVAPEQCPLPSVSQDDPGRRATGRREVSDREGNSPLSRPAAKSSGQPGPQAGKQRDRHKAGHLGQPLPLLWASVPMGLT